MLPLRYDYLRLINLKQQIVLLELLATKSLRTNELYKKGIFNSYADLSKNIIELLERDMIKRLMHNESNITYELTPKGYNFAVILASNEKRFNTMLKDFVIVVNIGRKIPDLLKHYIEYRIE